MSRLIGFLLKQKEDKIKLAYIILTILVVGYTIFLVIYDIGKMILVSENGAVSSSNFVLFNIVGIILGLIDLIFLIYILIENKRTIRSK